MSTQHLRRGQISQHAYTILNILSLSNSVLRLAFACAKVDLE